MNTGNDESGTGREQRKDDRVASWLADFRRLFPLVPAAPIGTSETEAFNTAAALWREERSSLPKYDPAYREGGAA